MFRAPKCRRSLFVLREGIPMLANPKGRLLRGALAAVLACGLMVPSGALAVEGRGSDTPPMRP